MKVETHEYIDVEFTATTTTNARMSVAISKQEFEDYTGECFSEESVALHLDDFLYEYCIDAHEEEEEIENVVWSDIHLVI